MKIDPNAPAMPNPIAANEHGFGTLDEYAAGKLCGLTIRAELAARAMEGILSSWSGDVALPDPAFVEQKSIQYADALIAALNKENT